MVKEINITAKKNDDYSFFIFVQSLIKKWWLFAIIGLIAAIAGFFYAKSQKPVYISNLTFVVGQGGNSQGLSGALNIAAQFGFNLGSGTNDMFSGDNIVEVIKSRRIVEDVLLSTDSFEGKPYTMAEYFIHKLNAGTGISKKYKNVHFLPWQTKASLTYIQDSLLYNTYLSFINNYIEADRPDKKLSIFSIRVTSDDERFAKIFTDKLIAATAKLYTEICSQKAKQTLDVLEQRVAAMKGNLSSSISGRAASQDANLNPAYSAAQVPVQNQQVNIQVYGEAYGEMFKNLELARFQYLNTIPLIQIIDAADYPMNKVKAGKIKTALMFAIAAVFITIFMMWLVRIYKATAG